jgi:hypothetical protein
MHGRQHGVTLLSAAPSIGARGSMTEEEDIVSRKRTAVGSMLVAVSSWRPE